MALVVPHVSEVELLNIIVGKTAASVPTLRLFTNNVTPDDDTILGSLTQCTAAGYSSIALTSASWSAGTTGGVTTSSFAQQTFTLTAAATIYGYYITDPGNTKLLWVERFPSAPFTLPSGGGTVSITPKINLA